MTELQRSRVTCIKRVEETQTYQRLEKQRYQRSDFNIGGDNVFTIFSGIICFWFGFISERELTFTFAICHRPSVCPSSVCLSSVTLVHPTQVIEIFGNVSTLCGTLAIRDLCIKILRRSSQGNPLVGGGLNPRGVAKYSDFRLFGGYMSETVQNRR